MSNVVIPKNVAQLEQSFHTLSENSSHVRSIDIDDTKPAVIVKLDGKAHFFGYQDMEIPIQRSKVEVAREAVRQLLAKLKSGIQPSHSDAQTLFDMVQQAR
jgi:hypothetical protein